jgi:cell division protein FtsZ
LLDSNDISGTKDILLNIISGDEEITMGEIGDIIEFLQDRAGQDANIIWGNGTDSKLGSRLSVTIAATRFDKNPSELLREKPRVEKLALDTDDIPDINLDEENYEGTVFEVRPEPQVTKARDSQKRSGTTNRKKHSSGELVKEKAEMTTDNWFKRQFNRLFDDQDESMTENN